MILPDFQLSTRRNRIWSESGIDSKRSCLNKKHFKNYPHDVIYEFNSRGFRDAEWPNDLEQAIWCFGDSFTVGMGSPIEHTWVNLLQSKTGRRCINISMDGASNQWICRKVEQVLETIKPKTICVQWSYLHRTESSDSNLSDESRRVNVGLLSLLEEHQDLFAAMNKIEALKADTNILYSIVPKSGIISEDEIKELINQWNHLKGASWPDIDSTSPMPEQVIKELKQFNWLEQFMLYKLISDNRTNFDKIKQIEQLDYARDYHHYDKLTAEQVVNDLLKLIDY